MSLIIKNAKINKTADLSEYHKQYRQENLEHIRNMDRKKYYKRKYHLDDDFVSLFGEYSGDVFKIEKDFKELITKCPELKEHILKRFTE